jgi:hypothetical protein
MNKSGITQIPAALHHISVSNAVKYCTVIGNVKDKIMLRSVADEQTRVDPLCYYYPVNHAI